MTMEILKIFSLVVGGFFIFSFAGIMSSWFDRKLTARLQWRVGPPWWQNFADFLKLTGKETVVPDTANQTMFLLSPVVGIVAVTVTGALLLSNVFSSSVRWDLFIFIYLLIIPSAVIFLGGSSSGNVLASVGAGRELRLLLSYELPFVISLLVPVIKSGSAQISSVVNYQILNGMNVGCFSGFIAFVVALLAFQGKIGYVPFDVSEAETELAAGTFIEYSGLPLALFNLMKWILLSVGISFLVIYFMGGFRNSLTGILKYLIILILIVLIKNTNPRLRTDQILKFNWGWLTIIGFSGVILALMGY